LSIHRKLLASRPGGADGRIWARQDIETYGLKATAERMFEGVFLLQPEDVHLDAQQRKAISDQL
jgi:hypothetical protein